MRTTVFCLLLIFSHAALADEHPRHGTSLDLFVKGDYAAARNTGRAENSAKGLTIACRAGVFIGGFLPQDEDPTDALHGAIRDCLKAVAIEPEFFDARLSLAVALSFEGKRTQKTSYPKLAKNMLEELVNKYPKSPNAYASLAAWHSQVSAAGFFARLALGASRKKAANYFHAAFKSGEMDFPLQLEYLKFLAVGNKKQRLGALGNGRLLLQYAPKMHIDEVLQVGCKAIVDVLETGKKSKIKAVIKKTSAFNGATDWHKADAFPMKELDHLRSD